MPTPVSGQVGEQIVSKGVSTQPLRQSTLGELVVSELHGRFYEQNANARLYSGGMTLTSINNATFTTATLGATCTPVIGVWNPANSGVNLVVLQAILSIILTALQNTGPGGFMWATATNQSAISTGNTPFNRKTLLAAGSLAKDMTGVALTGLVGNLALRNASALGGGNLYNIASLSTAAGFTTPQAAAVENLDGSFIVPPGGVLALLATTTPVAQSALAALLWEEVPT